MNILRKWELILLCLCFQSLDSQPLTTVGTVKTSENEEFSLSSILELSHDPKAWMFGNMTLPTIYISGLLLQNAYELQSYLERVCSVDSDQLAFTHSTGIRLLAKVCHAHYLSVIERVTGGGPWMGDPGVQSTFSLLTFQNDYSMKTDYLSNYFIGNSYRYIPLLPEHVWRTSLCVLVPINCRDASSTERMVDTLRSFIDGLRGEVDMWLSLHLLLAVDGVPDSSQETSLLQALEAVDLKCFTSVGVLFRHEDTRSFIAVVDEHLQRGGHPEVQFFSVLWPGSSVSRLGWLWEAVYAIWTRCKWFEGFGVALLTDKQTDAIAGVLLPRSHVLTFGGHDSFPSIKGTLVHFQTDVTHLHDVYAVFGAATRVPVFDSPCFSPQHYVMLHDCDRRLSFCGLPAGLLPATHTISSPATAMAYVHSVQQGRMQAAQWLHDNSIYLFGASLASLSYGPEGLLHAEVCAMLPWCDTHQSTLQVRRRIGSPAPPPRPLRGPRCGHHGHLWRLRCTTAACTSGYPHRLHLLH